MPCFGFAQTLRGKINYKTKRGGGPYNPQLSVFARRIQNPAWSPFEKPKTPVGWCLKDSIKNGGSKGGWGVGGEETSPLAGTNTRSLKTRVGELQQVSSDNIFVPFKAPPCRINFPSQNRRRPAANSLSINPLELPKHLEWM